MHLTWLRSDLRIDDNTALAAASERGPTLALWLVSPGPVSYTHLTLPTKA